MGESAFKQQSGTPSRCQSVLAGGSEGPQRASAEGVHRCQWGESAIAARSAYRLNRSCVDLINTLVLTSFGRPRRDTVRARTSR
eukprot:6884923-Alexandrium_andersonii.AAC.1